MSRVVARAAGKADLLDGLTSIAIDEVAYRKGQRYLTVVVDNDTGRLVSESGKNQGRVLGPRSLDRVAVGVGQRRRSGSSAAVAAATAATASKVGLA